MRKIIFAIASAALMSACSNNEPGRHDEHQGPDNSKKSLPMETKKYVAGAEVKINYHAPAVRGRVIWGGLVPFDSVWVSGAHKATSLELNKDFMVGGKLIPAGKYAIFTIPGKADWVVIINRNWDQHLADDYSETQDLIRVKVKPDTLAQISERLSYDIEPIGETQARISMSWEKLRIQFSLEVR